MPRRRRRGQLGLLALPLAIIFICRSVLVWCLKTSIGRVIILMFAAAVLDLWVIGTLAGSMDSDLARGAAIAFYIGMLLVAMAVFIALKQKSRLRARTYAEFLALTPRQFELAVGSLLRDIGYRGVTHVGGSGDLSADLRCRDDKGRSVVVQCKRHAPGISVGSRDMQAFIGMIAVHHRAERGIFVTTSDFTGPAAELAHEHGIDLIDGARLAALAGRGGIPAANQ
jgi:HJR/Mrr/RecB family endonuclease